PAVTVPERSPKEDQGGERQEVAVQYPLEGAGRRAKVFADVRQSNVDDGAVEEGHPGAQYRHRENPVAPGAIKAHLHVAAGGSGADRICHQLLLNRPAQRRGHSLMDHLAGFTDDPREIEPLPGVSFNASTPRSWPGRSARAGAKDPPGAPR